MLYPNCSDEQRSYNIVLSAQPRALTAQGQGCATGLLEQPSNDDANLL